MEELGELRFSCLAGNGNDPESRTAQPGTGLASLGERWRIESEDRENLGGKKATNDNR